jgi:hypothetical protein
MTGERTLAAHEQVPGSRQKAKGRRQKAEGKRQKGKGRRQKAEGRMLPIPAEIAAFSLLPSAFCLDGD